MISGPWNMNRGLWDVNRGLWSRLGAVQCDYGTWNVIMESRNVNRGRRM